MVRSMFFVLSSIIIFGNIVGMHDVVPYITQSLALADIIHLQSTCKSLQNRNLGELICYNHDKNHKCSSYVLADLEAKRLCTYDKCSQLLAYLVDQNALNNSLFASIYDIHNKH